LDGLLTEDQQAQPVDEQIKAIIAGGESDVVEFKSSMRWDYKTSSKNKGLESVIVKTVAGFMNGKGGTLLVGIGLKGEILGIENDYSTLQKDPTRDGFEQKLTHLLASYLGKEFVPLTHVSFVAVEDKDICWLRVQPSPKPVYVQPICYRAFLERLSLSAATINLHLSAIRRLADESAESGWLSPEHAIGIRRVKGVKRLGRKMGNWLTRNQAQELVNAASESSLVRC
jgi:predicted HTH transcriptional regulator